MSTWLGFSTSAVSNGIMMHWFGYEPCRYLSAGRVVLAVSRQRRTLCMASLPMMNFGMYLMILNSSLSATQAHSPSSNTYLTSETREW